MGIILKLDFTKAYDKVNWEFMFKCIKARGFNETLCSRIKKVVCEGTICVKVNNKEGPYFQSYKGVRQGDPLSPILFNLVADNLTRMVHQAQINGAITGLASDLIPNGVAILQYADDTIMCLKHCMNGASNLKIMLYIYEQMSGLKINFSKNEIVSINGDNDIELLYATFFNYQVGKFPINT